MKKILLVAVLLSIIGMLNAQKVTFGVDLFNRYIWRGIDLGGSSPSVQPYASIKFGNETHALTIGAWNAFTTAGTSNDETDLYLTYTFKECFNVTLTDYFFPGLNSGAKEKYFEWGADSTGHVLEGALNFSGTKTFPVTVLLAVNLYGNDARKTNGDLFLSKYLEVGYKKSFTDYDLNVFLGAALDNPTEGEAAYYLNEKAGIVNLGLKLSKTIAVTEKFSLPIQCSFITNPELQKVYFTLGISL
jgi:hypothetical protein